MDLLILDGLELADWVGVICGYISLCPVQRGGEEGLVEDFAFLVVCVDFDSLSILGTLECGDSRGTSV